MRVRKQIRGLFTLALLATATECRARAGLKKRLDTTPDWDKANAVVDAFRTSWEGYYNHAFPGDSLRPVSNTHVNDR